MGYKLIFKDTSDVLVRHCLPSISTRESAHTSWWVRLYSSLISRDNAVVNLWNNFLLLLRNSRVMVLKFSPLMKSHFPSYARVNWPCALRGHLNQLLLQRHHPQADVAGGQQEQHQPASTEDVLLNKALDEAFRCSPSPCTRPWDRCVTTLFKKPHLEIISLIPKGFRTIQKVNIPPPKKCLYSNIKDHDIYSVSAASAKYSTQSQKSL